MTLTAETLQMVNATRISVVRIFISMRDNRAKTTTTASRWQLLTPPIERCGSRGGRESGPSRRAPKCPPHVPFFPRDSKNS